MTTQQTRTRVVARPRGKNRRWVVVAVLTLLAITNYLDRGNLSVAAPLIQKDLNIDPAMMGVILSAFVWPYAIMNLPSGWACDRFGARVMMILAAGFWSLVSIATGFVRSAVGLVVLRVLLGVGESPMFPAAIKATNSWFPKREKAMATSVFVAGTQVGLAVAPPLATALMLAFGWPAMFVGIGLIGLVGFVGWVALYSEPDQTEKLSKEEFEYIRSDSGSQGEDIGASTEQITWRRWVTLFGHLPTWAMIVGDFALQYLFWFYITWLPSYLEKAQNFTISESGIVAALPYIAGTVGVLVGGRISDLMIRRGLAPLDGRRYTIAFGALITGVALLVTAFSQNPTEAVVLLTVGMFTYSLCSAPIWAIATDVVRSSTYVASIGSIQNFGGFLGGALAPVLTGLLVASSGGFTIALVVTGLLALASAATYALILRKQIPV